MNVGLYYQLFYPATNLSPIIFQILLEYSLILKMDETLMHEKLLALWKNLAGYLKRKLIFEDDQDVCEMLLALQISVKPRNASKTHPEVLSLHEV